MATRTSTLATFELVITIPETVSPECTVVSLMSTATIRGGALGGSSGTLDSGCGVAVGAALAAGAPPVGVVTGPGVGCTIRRGAGVAGPPVALGELPPADGRGSGAGRTRAVGVGAGVGAAVGVAGFDDVLAWLHAATARTSSSVTRRNFTSRQVLDRNGGSA